jgi:hypothetical protein
MSASTAPTDHVMFALRDLSSAGVGAGVKFTNVLVNNVGDLMEMSGLGLAFKGSAFTL